MRALRNAIAWNEGSPSADLMLMFDLCAKRQSRNVCCLLLIVCLLYAARNLCVYVSLELISVQIIVTLSIVVRVDVQNGI